MQIPEECKERYDRLARSLTWMRDEWKAKAVSPLVDVLPEGDAVGIMRWYADNDATISELGERLHTIHLSDSFAKLADMVERDYVRRELYDELTETNEKIVDKRDEALEIRNKALEDAATFKAERDEWKAKAEQALHENPFVGLVRGEPWERTQISIYYCGRCGRKVTEHDSYCPECGGALHGGSSKVRAGSSKRAAAVERLRNYAHWMMRCYQDEDGVTWYSVEQEDLPDSIGQQMLEDINLLADDDGAGRGMTSLEWMYGENKTFHITCMAFAEEYIDMMTPREEWLMSEHMDDDSKAQSNITQNLSEQRETLSDDEDESYGQDADLLKRGKDADCDSCEWPSLAVTPDREVYDRIAELTAQNEHLAADLLDAMKRISNAKRAIG